MFKNMFKRKNNAIRAAKIYYQCVNRFLPIVLQVRIGCLLNLTKLLEGKILIR